ncbi:MAG: hypothetical protein JXQ71_05225 [Verrucomicrobia bacterium]|nr:hypothetical protein [Verrucomicrobiota bacterium]
MAPGFCGFVRPPGGWWGLYEMVPGFGLGCVAIVGVSLLGPAPAPAITDMFARMRQQSGRRPG